MGAHRYAARRLQAAQPPDHLRGIRRGRGTQHQAALLLTTPQGRSSEPTRATASRSIYGWTWSRRRRCSTTGRASGRPGQHTLTIPRDEGTGQRVVVGDQGRQVDVDELAALNAHAPIDDAEVNGGRLAEDQRGKGIVDGAPGEGQCVEAEADEVRRHAGREVANIVAAKYGGAAPGGQPERLTGAHGGGVAADARHQQGLPRLR